MAIRKLLFSGVMVAALATTGVGLTAGTASASANCTGYLSEAYGFQSLGQTKITTSD
jgi:hypothetical protein